MGVQVDNGKARFVLVNTKYVARGMPLVPASTSVPLLFKRLVMRG
jgi:hypothetical protein